jgi:tellurite resistance protein
MMRTIGTHAALVYTMVLAAAADQDMSDREIHAIGEMIGFLPVFKDFSREHLGEISNACVDLLQDEDGIDTVLDQVKHALPHKLFETAYALACDIVAADGKVSQEELRMLELLQHKLEIDRLTATAIERGARARFMRG